VCLQTRKVWKGQLKDVSEKFPAVESLDLSSYAWLTDEELMGILVNLHTSSLQ